MKTLKNSLNPLFRYTLIVVVGLIVSQFNTYAQTNPTDSIPPSKKETPPKKKSKDREFKVGGIDIEISVNEKSDTLANDSTQRRRTTIKRKRKLSPIKTRWMMLDVGLATYLDDGSFNLSPANSNLDLNLGKSINVNLHIFRQRVSLIKNRVNLMYGAGLAFHIYNFDKNIKLTPNNEPLEIVVDETVNYKKNKLKSTYLMAPLMLNFNTNPRRSSKALKVSVGVFGGFLLASKTKQKSDEFGKVKFKDDFNLNKFRYGLMGEIGMGPINFYANYSLNGLFADGKGPDLAPFNVGIQIIPF